MLIFLFFFHVTATPEIYTLSLHDALPILVLPFPAREAGMNRVGMLGCGVLLVLAVGAAVVVGGGTPHPSMPTDRKSTRLNSSHRTISYAVFCLKKKIKRIEEALRADYVEW